MTKKKTKKTQLSGSKVISAHQFQQAMLLIESKKWGEAVDKLVPLSKSHPNSFDVWAALSECYSNLDQRGPLWQVTVNMLRLDPTDADNWFNVVTAAMMNGLIFTASYYADEFLGKFPNDGYAKDIISKRAMLEKALAEIQESGEIEPGATFEDLRNMEQINLALANNDFDLAETLIDRTLERSPTLVAPANNLSLVYGMQGEFDDAISAAQFVLEDHPDNVHALSNLAQFLWRSGKTAEAEALIPRLIRPVDTVDKALKQIEALSYLGQDAAIISLFEQFKIRSNQIDSSDDHSALAYHLVAVAYAHQGNDNQANRLWQTALRANKDLRIARQNLDNAKQPVGQRVKAFPFSFFQWVPIGWIQELTAILEVSQNKKTVPENALVNLFNRHPAIHVVLPVLLDRGDSTGRDFAIRIASAAKLPLLVEFALGEKGTDDERMNAAQKAAEQGLLPHGESLKFFTKGKQTETILISYEISTEPDFGTMPKAIQRLSEQTHDLLTQLQYEAAETLCRSAISTAPDEPVFWNHLSVALNGQHKTAEVKQITQEIFERFPDYMFGKTAMIQMLVKEKRLEEARAIMVPLTRQEKFHISEFRAFAIANIDLFLAEGEIDGALKMLTMWEEFDDEDNEALAQYQRRLRPRFPFLGGANPFLRSKRS